MFSQLYLAFLPLTNGVNLVENCTIVNNNASLSAVQVSTFNLILTLREDRPPISVALRNWLSQMTGSGKVCRVISPGFAMRKEKLYRSPSGTTLVSFQF